jgi:putative phosphoribosyl transferase
VENNAMEAKTKLQTLQVEIGPHRLPGTLTVPPQARGVVVFAHDIGSSRLSPRDQNLAQLLWEADLATLLFNMLEEREAEDRHKAFDPELLAERLQEAAAWVQKSPETKGLPLGFFGDSMCASAALIAAARQPDDVRAIVARGGRPDLARRYLPSIQAATLLIVAGEDEPVIATNQMAVELLRCEKRLEILPRPDRFLPGAEVLEGEVAALAADWLRQRLGPRAATA